jgi:hypothetical protein
MRIARDISNREIEETEFTFQIESLVAQYPELLAVTWINPGGRWSPPTPRPAHRRFAPAKRRSASTEGTDGSFELVRDLRQPVYRRPMRLNDVHTHADAVVPLSEQGRFGGAILAEYSIDGLLRFGVPPKSRPGTPWPCWTKPDRSGRHRPHRAGHRLAQLPWSAKAQSHDIPVSPVGNSLILRAEGFRTSRDTMSEAFFWIVGAMSVLTVWMLLGNMRHTRRRLQAQRALVAETNFRRAMENSMLTGMRALDLKGSHHLRQPGLLQHDRLDREGPDRAAAPFPYWPDAEHETLLAGWKTN